MLKRGGTEITLEIYIYIYFFLIYRICMYCALARPVHAYILRK